MKLKKISKAELEAIRKGNNREIAIEQGTNVNTHRVHKNKKAYNRKKFKKVNMEW